MFEPMIMGIAIATGSPPPTKPTITEVTALDDCTSAVARMPSRTPTRGLFANSKIAAAPSAPPETARKPWLSTPTAIISR